MGGDGLLAGVDREDVGAALRFLALVAVLAVLPGEGLGVLFGLNPRRVWLVVVFVAGLSFVGYLLSKVLDTATAIGVTGVLGGSVSPGLTIMSLTEQARRYPEFVPVYAGAGAIAGTMLFARNLVVVAIVNPSLARSLVVPFAGMAGVGVTVAAMQWSRARTGDSPATELDTPFRVRSALAFGALVAAVLVVVESFGLSLSTDTTRVGIVLATVFQLTVYTGVTFTASVTRMARAIAVILVGSAGLGIGLVVLT